MRARVCVCSTATTDDNKARRHLPLYCNIPSVVTETFTDVTVIYENVMSSLCWYMYKYRFVCVCVCALSSYSWLIKPNEGCESLVINFF